LWQRSQDSSRSGLIMLADARLRAYKNRGKANLMLQTSVDPVEQAGERWIYTEEIIRSNS
jgi:hypothetical protein